MYLRQLRSWNSHSNQSDWSSDHLDRGFDDDIIRVAERAVRVKDVLASTKTKASVAVGGQYQGTRDFVGDVDWIKVKLMAGKTYVIEELGSAGGGIGTLTDPLIVGVYDRKSALVASGNDDFGGTLNARIEFTPTRTGEYFIAASAAGSATGTYVVKVAVKDVVAPLLTSIAPSDGASNVVVNSDITLQFSENIQLGSGAITISDGSVSYTLTSSELIVSGNTLTINPASDLIGNTEYTVSLDANAVTDLSGNAYAGLSTYNFQTAADLTADSDTWNIMLYIAADNDLESFALWNLNQVESLDLPSNVKVTALVDRIGGYSSASGNWTDTRFGFIESDSNTSFVSSLQTRGTEQNMGNPATLTSFIQNASSLYPAENNILIIWNHGAGLSGAAWDDTNGYDHLTVSEMSTAISNAGVHFDIIGFDACLMATVEVVYSLQDYADYFVGSQDLEPGNGWAYDSWLSLFMSDPNPAAQAIADRAVSTYVDQYPGMQGIQLSSLDMAFMPQLSGALKTFSDYAVTASASDISAISSAAQAAQNYPDGDADPNIDIGNFMQRVFSSGTASATLKAEASAVITALDAAITSHAGTVAASTGLSIYLPSGWDSIDGSYTATNFEFLAGVPNWDNMLALI